MPGYDDDFQGYTIGDQVPFGSWVLDPAVLIGSQIVAGSGPTGTTQSYKLFGTVCVDPLVTKFQDSFTEYIALRKVNADSGPILAFVNGPNGSGHSFTLVTIQVERDGTLSVIGPDSTVIANSHDDWFEYNVVNFFQINVQLTDEILSGVTYVNVNVQVGLNGRQICSVHVRSNFPVNNLTNATSEVNRFQLTGSGFFSAFTLTSLQSMPSYPHAGSPAALAFQAVAEVNTVPDSGKIRIIQAAAEADTVPDTTKLRVIQAVAEVDAKAANRWYISES